MGFSLKLSGELSVNPIVQALALTCARKWSLCDLA